MPPTVFISYSHKDEAWKDRLVTHLAGLKRNGLLQTWDDREIRAGQNWLQKIEEAMQEARVAVLLVSPDFLDSGFIQTHEVPPLLAREGVHVVPVIVKDCLWEKEIRISRLQVLPRDGKALETITRSKWNTELKKIAKEILELLGNDAPPQTVPGTKVEPSPPRPILAALHQLPPPPGDFTGRKTDLAELRAAVVSGGVTISGVRGIGGIGKTALALKLAQELTPQYPDAQIYLDLQGVSVNPLSSTQAMGHVIRSFHPDVRLPESEAETAALYRSALHGRRALLLMDNASDRVQVELLLPPAGNLLLVTSRTRFHLPGLKAKDLDELPLKDARELLLHIAPRIGDQADRIAEVCAGIPFALRQAAGTLSERPDLSPASYTARLASGKDRLGLIEASLRLSYDLLPEELACHWRTLSVFPSDFDVPAAAAVWDLEQDEAEIALGKLVQRSLVNGENGRYRLHDLARVFASSRMLTDERDRAERRHSTYYRDILNQANVLFLQGDSLQLAGLRLVDQEWLNIQAGRAWAVARLKDDLGAARLAESYPRTGIFCLDLRLRPREQIGWFETALEAARLLQDRYGEGIATGNLGNAYMLLGETHRAIELYEKQLAITCEIGDRHGEGYAKGNLGNAYMSLGETHRAIELYEQGLTIKGEIGDRRAEGNAKGNLGAAYAALGDTKYAIELYQQELAIAREIGDRLGEGRARNNLGAAYNHLGESHQGIEHFKQARAIAYEIGDRRGEAKATFNLGTTYEDIGEIHRAIEHFNQCLTMFREIGDRRWEANTCWSLGLALENLGDLEKAEDLMQVRISYEREIDHPEVERHAAHVAALRARLKAEFDPSFDQEA